MAMGMNRSVAEMVSPKMWITPGGSDPFNPAIIMIVNAAQARMRELGFKTEGHGFAEKPTQAAFARVSGPQWKDKAWIQIYGDLLNASKAGLAHRKPMGDSMHGNYTQGLGAIANVGWCSDRNPQPPCKPRRGVCTPKDAATLASFKAAQNGINRILKAKGKGGYISVDGRPGSGTVKALERARVAAGLPGGQALGPFTHCDQFSAVADVIAITLNSLADKMGVAKIVKPAVSFSAPSMPTPGGGVYNPPAQAGIAAFAQSTTGMVVIAGGVLAFLYMRKPKRKKPVARKRKKPVRRRRTPRRRITRTYY